MRVLLVLLFVAFAGSGRDDALKDFVARRKREITGEAALQMA